MSKQIFNTLETLGVSNTKAPPGLRLKMPDIYYQAIEQGKINPKSIAQNTGIDCIYVVIPNHNNLKWAYLLIDSLEKTTTTQCQINIIFIDDHSTDNSFELIRQPLVRLVDRGFRCRVLSANQRGVSAARNLGIIDAVSYAIQNYGNLPNQDKDFLNRHWLCFIDADDFISENFFSAFEQKINANPDLLLPMSRIPSYSHSTEQITESLDDHSQKYNVEESDFPILNDETYRRVVARCLFRLDIIANNEIGFPAHINYGEDLTFNWTYSLFAAINNKNARAVVIPDSHYYYRKDHKEDSLSAIYEKSRFDQSEEKIRKQQELTDFFTNFSDWYKANLTTEKLPSYLGLQLDYMFMNFMIVNFLPTKTGATLKYIGKENKLEVDGFNISQQNIQMVRHVFEILNESNVVYNLTTTRDQLISFSIVNQAFCYDRAMASSTLFQNGIGNKLINRQDFLATDVRHHIVDPVDIEAKVVSSNSYQDVYQIKLTTANIEVIRLFAMSMYIRNYKMLDQDNCPLSVYDYVTQNLKREGSIKVDKELINIDLSEQYIHRIKPILDKSRSGVSSYGAYLFYNEQDLEKARNHLISYWSKTNISLLQNYLDRLIFEQPTDFQKRYIQELENVGLKPNQAQKWVINLAPQVYQSDSKQVLSYAKDSYPRYSLTMFVVDEKLRADVLALIELRKSELTAKTSLESIAKVCRQGLIYAIKENTNEETIEIAKEFVATHKGFKLLVFSDEQLADEAWQQSMQQNKQPANIWRNLASQNLKTKGANLALAQLKAPEYEYITYVFKTHSDVIVDQMMFNDGLHKKSRTSFACDIIGIDEMCYYKQESDGNIFFNDLKNERYSSSIFSKFNYYFKQINGQETIRLISPDTCDEVQASKSLVVFNVERQNYANRHKVFTGDNWTLTAALNWYKESSYKEEAFSVNLKKQFSKELLDELYKDIKALDYQVIVDLHSQYSQTN